MSQPEEKINCPHKFGEKTRGECHECEYRSFDVCPVGTHFARNKPEDRPVWEPHLVKEEASDAAEVRIVSAGEPVCCPECGGEHFALRKIKLSDRMLASARLYVSCVKCGYSESLYEIGGRK